ncbi:MAG: hypothetical protein WD969_16025 [Paracoccaceae bacterium]
MARSAGLFDLDERYAALSTTGYPLERLSGAVEALFARLDAHLKERGYLATGGRTTDASIIDAPRQRNTDGRPAGPVEHRLIGLGRHSIGGFQREVQRLKQTVSHFWRQADLARRPTQSRPELSVPRRPAPRPDHQKREQRHAA